MSKSLVIFDLYNTLITDPFINERHQYRMDAIWSTLEKSGHPIQFKDVISAYQKSTEYMQKHQKNCFSLSLFDLVKNFSNLIHLTDLSSMKKIYDIWSFAVLHMPPLLIPNIKEGLEILKNNGKKIGLISNTASTPGIALRFILKDFGILDYFDDLVFSDEFGFMKPNRMIFNRVLDHLDTKASDAIFVGDHEYYDKLGATNAGIDYLLMNPELNFHNVVQEILSK